MDHGNQKEKRINQEADLMDLHISDQWPMFWKMSMMDNLNTKIPIIIREMENKSSLMIS